MLTSATVWAERRRSAGIACAMPAPVQSNREPQKATRPLATPIERAARPELKHTSIADQQVELVRRYQAGDRAAGNILLEANNKLIWAGIKRYRSKGLDDEDLLQAGRMGLLHALSRYEPAKGAMSTYAQWWIRHYATRALENEGSTIRIPVRLQMKAWKEARSGGDLSPVAAEAVRLRSTASIDASLTQDDDATMLDMTADTAASPEELVADMYAKEHARRRVGKAMIALTPREREVVRRLHLVEEPETQADVGRSLGLCRERIRQIDAKAMDKVTRALTLYNPCDE